MGSFAPVLIVSADKAATDTLASILGDKGSEVSIVSTFVDGSRVFSEGNHPIVILDHSLAESDLVGFVKGLCSEDPQVLVMVMVERGQEHQILDALRSGAGDVVQKPVVRDAFIEIMSRFTGVLARRDYEKYSQSFFEEVRLELKICCSTQAVSNAVSIVSRLLAPVYAERELLRLELGLQEVFRNALEHGCLGVNFDEKKNMCEVGSFDSFVEKESANARKAGKIVHVIASMNDGLFTCVVSDPGKGFDWQKMKEILKTGDNSELYSGRGILLVEQVFDQVSYNKIGNQTTLLKQLPSC